MVAMMLLTLWGPASTAGAAPPDEGPGLPPDQVDLAPWVSQFREVFGVPIFATNQVTGDDVDHVRDVLKAYLDNNRDGRPDNRKVVKELIRSNAGMVMFSNEDEAEKSTIWESRQTQKYELFLVSGDETNVAGRFDASLEEVLHMITDSGYGPAYPSAFGAKRKSQLGRLTSAAVRRGDFVYDDPSCDFSSCMMQEYFYWSVTSLNGLQEDRCEEISDEWRNCTPELMRLNDPKMVALITKKRYRMPLRPIDVQP